MSARERQITLSDVNELASEAEREARQAAINTDLHAGWFDTRLTRLEGLYAQLSGRVNFWGALSSLLVVLAGIVAWWGRR